MSHAITAIATGINMAMTISIILATAIGITQAVIVLAILITMTITVSAIVATGSRIIPAIIVSFHDYSQLHRSGHNCSLLLQQQCNV
jgi:hypothetical protein